MTTVLAPAFSEVRPSRTARVALALAIVFCVGTVAVHFASSSPAPVSLATWLGRQIVTTHAVPRTLGTETFSSPGAPAVPYGWLGDVGLYLASATFGREGIFLWCCGALFAALSLLYARCRTRELGAPYTAGALAVAVLATLGTSLRDSQTLNWAFLGAVLLVLESRDRRRSLAVIPLTVLWCNVDPAGLLAPLATLLFALGTFAEERRFGSASRHAILLVAGTTLGMLATPWGLALPVHALAALGLDPALRDLTMWQSPGLRRGAYACGFIALTILGVLSSVGQRSRRPELYVMLGAGLLSLCDAVYLQVFAFACAPVVARAVQRAVAETTWNARLRSPSRLVCVGAAIGIAAAFWTTARQAPTARPSADVVAAVAADHLRHRIFCARSADCDIIVAGGTGRLRVFMDGRAGAFATRVRRDQTTIAAIHPGWRERLASWRIDTIVVGHASTLGAVLALIPGRWHLAASDGAFDVFERSRR